jgi:protein involved in polysaccharide export with SLBB domain
VKEILTYVGTVILEGEVKRPGSYPIIRDSTTLSQVIARAGGFTKYAALNASKIIRESGANTLRDIEYHNLRKGLTSTEDTTYLANEMLLKSGGELSSTDFVSLFEKNDRTKDVVLKNGDRIIIPQKINAVYVFGEVRNPGYVAFSSGKTIDYFISLAGGLTGSAETGDIRVVKASTKQWLLPGETTIEEGDYIWIPRTPFRSYSYYLSIYSQVFGIIATAMSLVLLVTR